MAAIKGKPAQKVDGDLGVGALAARSSCAGGGRAVGVREAGVDVHLDDVLGERLQMRIIIRCE